MKRFHVHLRVEDLPANIAFYTALFGCPPARRESDYAKWMLDDPRINFAISTRGQTPGIDHLGIQVDSAHQLEHLNQRLVAAAAPVKAQKQAACCYAESDKYWTVDPKALPGKPFTPYPPFRCSAAISRIPSRPHPRVVHPQAEIKPHEPKTL